jgi:hypothetical protein
MVSKKEEKSILKKLILRCLEGEKYGLITDRLVHKLVRIGVNEIVDNEIEFTPTRISMLARNTQGVRGRRGQYFLITGGLYR